MLTSHRASAVSFAIAFAFCVARSEAATITWSAATNVNNSSDVATNGTYVDALHANPGQGNQTIGDTIFHEQSTSSVAGTFTGATSNISIQTNGPIGAGNGSSLGQLPASVTGTYSTVLYYLDYGSEEVTLSQSGTITLSGLGVGSTYQVQIWSVQLDNQHYVTTYTSGANSVSLQLNPGQFTLGTFVADAATQSLTIQYTSGNARYYALNAVALRQLPEPGSLGIIGCAGMILAARRRK